MGPALRACCGLLAVVLAVAAGAEEPTDPADATREALDRYEADARALLDAIDTGAPPEEIRRRSLALMAAARVILGDFAVRYPPCGPYFRATFGLEDRLGTISVDEVEAEYHADGLLPSAPAFCYHAKDFYVHPGSVVVLLRVDADRARMGAEIREVLAHVGIVRALFAQTEAATR